MILMKKAKSRTRMVPGAWIDPHLRSFLSVCCCSEPSQILMLDVSLSLGDGALLCRGAGKISKLDGGADETAGDRGGDTSCFGQP
jgi:hypothetical protein